jgi:hypothetical protein
VLPKRLFSHSSTSATIGLGITEVGARNKFRRGNSKIRKGSLQIRDCKKGGAEENNKDAKKSPHAMDSMQRRRNTIFRKVHHMQ